MTERKSLAVISVITVIVCLFALFAGLSANSTCRNGVAGEKKTLDDLTERCDKLDDALNLLDTDAEKYAALKAEYNSASDEYDAELKEHEDAVKKYDESVLGYNQNLIGMGASSIEEGKAMLNQGWSAYNEGLAAYNEGKAQFDEGVAQYNQLMDGISQLESKGIPHAIALATISLKAGTTINDQTISEMKAAIDEGQAQLDSAKVQLDDAKAQLDSGQAQLNEAEQQMGAMGSTAPASLEELESTAADIEADQKALDDAKAALDEQKEELKKYENAEETVSRSVSKLVDSGIAEENSTPEEALKLAQAEQEKLLRAYNFKSAAFTAGLVLLLCDIAYGILAVAAVSKQKDSRAIKFAASSSVISVIVCVAATFYSLGSLAISLLLLLACAISMILAIKREAAE